MPQNYTVQSFVTGYYIISNKCDVAGQTIATAGGKDSIPEGVTLTFSEALQTDGTEVTIKGISGLYVALPKNATSGSLLVWSSKPATWRVNATKIRHHEIVLKDQDLYWSTVGLTVQVKSGEDIKGMEKEWALVKVD